MCVVGWGSGGRSRRVDGSCKSPTIALNVLSQDTRILGRLDWLSETVDFEDSM